MTGEDNSGASLTILDALPAWVLVVDCDLTLRFANRSYLDAQETELEAIVGRSLAEVFLPGRTDAEQVLAAVRESVDAGGAAPVVRYFAGMGLERALDLES